MKEKHILKECIHHGNTEFILEGRDYYRCKKCRSESVTRRRKLVKEKLVKDFGGQCSICGYDKYVGALEFHHLIPAEKGFGIAHRGLTKAYKTLLKEAEKCILVCANCHREIEANVIKI